MSRSITAAQVKAIAGSGARAELVAAIVRGWPTAVAKGKITTRLRASHFLAQIMTETGGLRVLEESGAYTYKSILKIFGARQYSLQHGGRGHSAGITPDEARRIAALPVEQRGPVLFNRTYGVGNKIKAREFQNYGANDGWLYRGGGMMQATGKSNYAALAKKTGLPLVEHPELLRQPDSAFMAAILEWSQDGRCNAAADRDDVVAVRQVINGGQNGIAECRVFLGRAKKALADYNASDVAAFVPAPVEAEDLDADQAPVASSPSSAASTSLAAAAAADPQVEGDPLLYQTQRRLKAMNYNPGLLDGLFGGKTVGAISAFLLDRRLKLDAPKSLEEFHTQADQLSLELQRAEFAHFVRPVTAARASGDATVVAEAAPEVVPAKRGMLAAAWSSVVMFFGAVWDSISSYVASAWDFITDHKDDLPSDPGLLDKALGYLHAIPVAAWLALGGVVLLFIAINARSAVAQIKTAVQTGARS